MPHIPGQWFPRANDGELFYASMLALLRPWRSILDIKNQNETFASAYNRYMEHVPEHITRIISNIQYFHECADKANQEHQKTCALHGSVFTSIDSGNQCDDELEDTEPIEGEDTMNEECISNDDILNIMEQPTTTREIVYAGVAMNIAQEFNFFTDDTYHSVVKNTAKSASEEDLEKASTWEHYIEESAIDHSDHPTISRTSDSISSVGMNNNITESRTACSPSATLSIADQRFLPIESAVLPPSHLNQEQALAFTIISRHIVDLLQGKNPPQLLMVIHGQGGTGKTCLLNAITALFNNLGCAHRLAKTALTGVAASQIGGKTLHSWATIPATKGLPRSENWIFRPTKETAKRRTANMQGKWLLAADEMSLLTLEVFWLLSQVLTAFRAGEGMEFKTHLHTMLIDRRNTETSVRQPLSGT